MNLSTTAPTVRISKLYEVLLLPSPFPKVNLKAERLKLHQNNVRLYNLHLWDIVHVLLPIKHTEVGGLQDSPQIL